MIRGEVIRWGLLALGACLGLVAAFLYGWCFLNFHKLPPRDSFGQQGLIFGGCVVFFAVIYNVGVWGYRLLGKGHEAENVTRQQRWHMLILNLLAVLIMIAAWIFD